MASSRPSASTSPVLTRGEDGASVVSISQAPNEQRRRSERDQFSTVLDPTDASFTTSTSSKPRRPSSVFEHVGGMLDRFGRRLHSRSEVGAGQKRPSSTALSLNAASDSSEAVSLEDYSPNSSTPSNPLSAQQRISPGLGERTMSNGSGGEGRLSPSRRGSEHSSHSYGNHQIYSAGSSSHSTASRGGNSSQPPSMQREHSAGSLSVVNDSTSPSQEHYGSRISNFLNSSSSASSSSRDPRRISCMDRTLIQITEDNERFSVVDISGLNAAAAIKERMLSKLHLFDEDPSCFALSRTEIGAMGSTGPRIDDDELLAMCWQLGDEKGSLKFLLHQIAPPTTAGRAMMPPPPPQSLSPRIVMRDLTEENSTGNDTATTPTSYSRQPRSQPDSASSRSSVGANEQQTQAEAHAANDSSSESSSRPQSGLHRFKATNRRSLAASTSIVDDMRHVALSNGRDEAWESESGTNNRLSATSSGGLSAGERDRYRSQASPIEEISDMMGPSSGRFATQRRLLRPESSSQLRHSVHSEWDGEIGQTSPRRDSSGFFSRTSPDHARPTTHRTTSHPPPFADTVSISAGPTSAGSAAASVLPRSLLPGGRDLRSSDGADAAHMYVSSSDHDYQSSLRPHASYSSLNTVPNENWRQARPFVSPARQSRPSLSSTSEVGAYHAEQNRTSDARQPDPTYRSQSANPFGPRPRTSDANVSVRPFNNGQAVRPHPHGVPYSASHASPPTMHGVITSPVSPMGQQQPFDRDPSLSFGAGGHSTPLLQGIPAQNAHHFSHQSPQSNHYAPQDPRLYNRPIAPTVSTPRPNVQHHGNQSGVHSPHVVSPQYLGSPPIRPSAVLPQGQGGDRRFVGAQQQPQHQPQPMNRPSVSDFGYRGSPYDHRMVHSAPRPSPPMVHLQQQQERGRFQPMNMPQATIPQFRDDSYAAVYYPASNARLVTEFQRTAGARNAALQPGMTVQETLSSRPTQPRPPPQGVHYHHTGGAVASPGPGSSPAVGVFRNPRPALPAGAIAMSHSPSVSTAYGRDDRPFQGPPSAGLRGGYENRADVQQQVSAESSSVGNAMPASMQYYYNPATPMNSNRPPAAIASTSQPQSVVSSTPVHLGASSERPMSAASEPPLPTSKTVNESERSSGSSFVTSSSAHHIRLPSSNDGRRLEGIDNSAPTSARSSRSISPEHEKGASVDAVSDLPYVGQTALSRSGSLNDDELLNVRPLPQLPPPSTEAAATQLLSNELQSEGEDTFKAGQWQQVLNNLDAEQQGDTLRAGTLPDKQPAPTSNTHSMSSTTAAPSNTSLGTLVSTDTERVLNEPDEDEGAFKTFDDEDEDEDDGAGTWAQPLDSVRDALPEGVLPKELEQHRVKSPVEIEGTLKPAAQVAQSGANTPVQFNSPRRPVLTLNIEPVTSSPHAITEVPTTRSQSPKPTDAVRQASSSPASSTAIGRRTSFARREGGDWAFRPPPEQLYDNLDDFFPKHDLDKPVLEPNVGTVPASPLASSPRSDVTAPMSAVSQSSVSSSAALGGASALNRSRMGHKKSIRIVAQDRKRFLERAEASDRRKADATDLSRRRSTKLWGGKVIEVTPGSADVPALSSIDSPLSATSSDAVKPVFKWVKGDLIGKGTYGRVYLALNATTGEMLAVKQVELPTTASDREDARQKGVVSALKSEIETLKDLDHPNIVSYLGFEETQSNLSIFLEYVPGGSVGSCMRKHGKLDEATIKSFLQQILNGLNYLHGRGILHRDLKADNLLVDFNGIVKISDFGTVRKSEDIYGNVASMSMQGSIFWMAPEVVSLSRAGYSAKVDIWSLGCVVLEMFAGRRPWSDEEAVQAMFKIGAERRAPPIPPDVRLSKAAAHFLKTCFAVDPNERPTASRLLDHVFPHAEPGWKFSMSSLYRQLHR